MKTQGILSCIISLVLVLVIFGIFDSEYFAYRLPMAERVWCGTPCLLRSLGEVVGSHLDRGKSQESVSSYQETGKVLSPEMSFYSKF